MLAAASQTDVLLPPVSWDLIWLTKVGQNDTEPPSRSRSILKTLYQVQVSITMSDLISPIEDGFAKWTRAV